MADPTAAAVQFLELFPECQAWDVVILDQQKRKIGGAPSMATALVRSKISEWMAMYNTHVFIRPLLGNLVFLDLDSYFSHNKDFDLLFKLRPRAVVRTSQDNYQAWLTLPLSLASQHALQVASDLTALFHADPGSVRAGQQGRLPGTVNAKQGKGGRAELLHGAIQDIDPKEYMGAVPRQAISVRAGELRVVSKAAQPKAEVDRSGKDWQMCCAFFESNKQKNEEEAFTELRGRFSKSRLDSRAQERYEKQTIAKAYQKVASLRKGIEEGRLAAWRESCAKAEAEKQGRGPQTGGASDGAAQDAEKDGGVSISQVKQLIAVALSKALPRAAAPPQLRKCSQCGEEKGPSAFTDSQLRKSDAERQCRVCKPVDERNVTSAVSGKSCVACAIHKGRGDYSDNQWRRKEGEAKCKSCVSAFEARKKLHVRTCVECAVEKSVEQFSKSQMAKAVGQSVCMVCADKRMVKGWDNVVPMSSETDETKGVSPEPDHWEEKSKDAANRWILEAPEVALPSEITKSYQAILGAHGRDGWWTQLPKDSVASFPAHEKLRLLKVAHEHDLRHLGGRDRLLKEMQRALGTTLWPNAYMDCQWVVQRCEQCRASSCRDMAQEEPRHLPRPDAAGEIVGWDLKKMVVQDGSCWYMLLGVDFATNKIWAWDLDKDEIDVKHVQGRMLRWQQDNDLLEYCWSDNGGQFKNTIQEAMQQAFQVKPRHIPPGHPQSNGKVEALNKVMDALCGGQRERLQSAVVAYNNTPRGGLDVCPESLWREMRPRESRWRGIGLRMAVHGRKELSDDEWQRFLETNSAASKRVDAAQMCDEYERRVKPLRDAMSSDRLRQSLSNRMKMEGRASEQNNVVIVTGDRVICKNTQYTAKGHALKFQHKGGERQEFTVRNKTGGLVDVEEVGTGLRSVRHESSLKLLPKVYPAADVHVQNPDDQDLPKDVLALMRQSSQAKAEAVVRARSLGVIDIQGQKFTIYEAKDDGRCFFRCTHMALSGADGGYIDDTAASDRQQKAILDELEDWANKAKGDARRALRMSAANEMKDDPRWDQTRAFTWERYFAHMRTPKAFATNIVMAAAHRLLHRRFHVYQKDEGDRYKKVYTSDGPPVKGPDIHLLYGGVHFSLLVPCPNDQIARDEDEPPAKRARTREAAHVPVLKRPAQAEPAPMAAPLLKRPAKDTKFGRCPLCDASMQIVPPQEGGRPMLGCSKFRKGCRGYLRHVLPREESLMPARFVMKVRVDA